MTTSPYISIWLYLSKAGFILTAGFFQCSAWHWAVVFSFRFHAATQLQNTHAERSQTTNEIVYYDHETILKLNFHQLMEQCNSRGSVLIFIYRLDAHDLKNKNAHVRERQKKKKKPCDVSINIAERLGYRL